MVAYDVPFEIVIKLDNTGGAIVAAVVVVDGTPKEDS